jgi:putative protein-disulfide isomerase
MWTDAMSLTLYYVHDPMCSWCYGFTPTWRRLLERLPGDIAVVRLLGGLAADCDEPMAPEMRMYLQQTWHRIQHRIPGTDFNFEFWSRCEPQRSTWPACRAVIAARSQDPAFDEAMTQAIQRAYYREARNPSDRAVLIDLAGEIGANKDRLALTLDAAETRSALESEITRARAMGADSFPSLILEQNHSRWRIPVDYTDVEPMLATLAQAKSAGG